MRTRRFLAVPVVSAVVMASGLMVVAQGAMAAPADPSGRYLVEFRPGAAPQGHASLKKAGATVVVELSQHNAAAVTMPTGRVDALRRSAGISHVEADVPRYMLADQIDPKAQVTPYGVDLTQASQVTATNPAGKKVCIIDSGYSSGHADLPSKNVSGSDDISGAGPWDVDGSGHGTHVAGTIAAVDNSRGVAGVDPGVGLHIVRVFGDDGLWAYSSTLVKALDECKAAGANVVNMSLGGTLKSKVEEKAFASAYAAGILAIAAAGNDGNTRTSYPAGYASVVSVAAVDVNSVKADFSQVNRDVEIAAPGVDVLSTVPFISTATLAAGRTTWSGSPIEGAAQSAGVTGSLTDGGLCNATGDWTGMVVLCQRGTTTFAEKVARVEANRGVAAVIYNNVPGSFIGTLGTGVTSAIPAISLSDTDGLAALASVGSAATVVNTQTKPASGYEAWSGTSMATPHVAGIAALIWSCKPNAQASDIRTALTSSAKDLGALGRDTSYGYGLVQAQDALKALTGSTTC